MAPLLTHILGGAVFTRGGSSKRKIHSMGSRPRVKPVIDTSEEFFASGSIVVGIPNHETDEWEGGIQS